ncbi:hypothetical protein [Rhizobium rhizophilum]|uniref:Uncharacterized protein n=1 Tax=Rhizobium rhizophilum TaxID=1850373 RepID=A0ABY2R064_9HYPH|nr:hypothetical protein [Rhizobium rhizophilum]THV17012.1 hypothetical protein E9677_03165 [Rhizobium rhizophilum]
MEHDLKTLEARLNAHREILVSLLSELLVQPDRVPELLRNLEQEVLLRDGSEDPGSEPSAGIGRGHEKGEAIREILDTAKARAAALRRSATDLGEPNGFTQALTERT